MTHKIPKKRSGLLTAWFLVVFVASVGLAYVCLAQAPAATPLLPELAPKLLLLYGLLNLVNALCVIFMFRWHKWAFSLFGLISTALSVLNLIILVPNLTWLWVVLGLVVAYFVLRPKWEFAN